MTEFVNGYTAHLKQSGKMDGFRGKYSTTSGEDYDDVAMEDSDENGYYPNDLATRSMAEESGMYVVKQTVGTVVCSVCGIKMAPNAANKCVRCLLLEVDITEGLQKRVFIIHCPECDSYLQPPHTWINAQLESMELMRFCVDRVKNLKTVKIADAAFIWTEPHSKRLKVKLRIQKAVDNGAILEQTFVVVYVVQDHRCKSCSRVQANPDQWVAAVQLRQHVTHRRTFFYLEQLILKHDAAVKAITIKEMNQGIDFNFRNRSHALNFVEFIGKFAPIKKDNDKQLVSRDTKSNRDNNKYTFSVEICPICREDLICLPPEVALSLGNFGPLVICTKVSNRIALVDPFTLRCSVLKAEQYWHASFMPLMSSRQLVKYIVFDIVPVSFEVSGPGSKYILADAQIARVSDFGENNTIFYVRTHLGHILSPGDFALGYDLYGANIEIDNKRGVPDAILVKKSYEGKRLKKRDKEYQHSETASMTDGGEDVPSVPIEELFDDLDLRDEDEEADMTE